MKKLTNKQIVQLLVEAENIQASLAAVKPLYNRLDEITLALIGQDTSFLSKHNFTVVDNFASKNTVFKVTGVKRFELKKTA